MTRDWSEHPEAREEFLDAHDRYLDAGGRIADEFADAAEHAAELIIEWPDAPPPYHGQRGRPIVRARHLGKFPYKLIYMVHEREIFILAYAHESRRPGYWEHRLDG
ncbi:hypothetical protein ATJ78_2889 [Paramicrobacterium agarici]|uniref:ParE-like toxin of type II ParDE toxin-antitoxin system n=1 Tax=Paramicrobacterium agarici TaxID=630514 RepID=A0A2A9DZU7_9MICO|nr:hypothetical protein ATJ78_2889 [Microbacterium agarici]